MKTSMCVRLIALCLTLICMLTFFTGSLAEGIKLDDNEYVEIKIVGSLKNFEGLEAVIIEFEKLHSNCTVTYEYLDDYTNTVVNLLQSDAADTQLFMSFSSVFTEDDIRTAVAVDYADPINGIDYSQANSAVMATKIQNGKLYTVPLALNPRGMMVNVDLLKKYGLSIPTTFDEFLVACETLKSDGLIPIQGFNNDFGINFTIAYTIGTIAKMDNADEVYSELNAWTPGSSKYFRCAFDAIDTVMTNGYADEAENAKQKDGYESSILNFFNGDVAFFPCSSETFSGTIKRQSKSEYFTANPFEYVFCSVPMDETGGYIYWQSWQGISVNKLAENEEWARAFADFLFQKENMALLANIKGMVPNTNVPGDDDRYIPLYSVPESNIVVADKVSQQVVAILQDALASMTSSARLDVESAMARYEELAAEKAAQ